jgi:hypothetical protein
MNNSGKYQEALLNAFLGLSSEASNLRGISYARLVLGVLFIEDGYLDIKQITEGSAQLLNINGTSEESIKSALKILEDKKLLELNDGKWKLHDSEREKIAKQLEYTKEATGKIIKSFFPISGVDFEVLVKWFNEFTHVYFSLGADKLIKLYNAKQRLIINFEEQIKPTISKFKLDKFEIELINGYKEFLASEDEEVEKRIFNIMSALLSTKLVASDVSPDLISIERYKNSEIIVDTNVLYAYLFGKTDSLNKAFKSFGRMMSSMGAKLYYTQATAEEFERVREREKENFLKLWKEYTAPVIKMMSRNDDFSKAILQLQCQTEDDVETFFTETIKIPDDIGGAKLELLNCSEADSMKYDEAKDKELFEKIQVTTVEIKGHKKGDLTVAHDVALTKLVNELSKSRNIFILTLDSGMEILAMRETHAKDLPVWRSLYSIIKILAINGGGSDFNPSDLAPIFKSFMEFEDIQQVEKYDKRDLLLLSSKFDRAKELPDEKIISILTQLHKARLANSDSEALRLAVLELERSLRYNEEHISQKLQENEEKINELSKTVEKKSADKDLILKELNCQKRKGVWTWFVLRSLTAIAISVFVFFYLIGELLGFYKTGDRYSSFQIFITILAPLIYMFSDFLYYTKAKLDVLK